MDRLCPLPHLAVEEPVCTAMARAPRGSRGRARGRGNKAVCVVEGPSSSRHGRGRRCHGRGGIIRPKRIYNCLCYMLVFYQLPYVFYMFYFVFRTFSWTNLLTQCLESVPVFCSFCISEKLLKKYSPKVMKMCGDHFFTCNEDIVQRRARGEPYPRHRLGVTWWPPTPPRTASSPIKSH